MKREHIGSALEALRGIISFVMHLQHKQIEMFQRDGFLLLKNFATADELDVLKQVALTHAKLSAEPIETEAQYNLNTTSVPTIRRLRQLYDRDKTFALWMTLPRIRPALQQLLGDEVCLTLAHHNSLMTKMPHTSTQSDWHQDKRYWHFDNDNLISVWLALDEENKDNGVLEFIPGSHTATFSPHAFDARGFFRSDLQDNRVWIDKRTSFDLHGGDVILFHCKTLHRADKNSSDEAKLSIVYTVHGKKTHALKNSRSAAYSTIVLPKI